MEYTEIICGAYVKIKQKLLAQIELYVDTNFINIKYSIDRSLSPRQQAELEARLRRIKQTFPQYLLAYIAKRGLSEVEVYKKAHIDRRIFSKLRNEKDYMPSERTIWAIALAMELNIDEATDLLNEAGFALSYNNKEDVIIRFFFEKHIYDSFLVNEVLDHYGFKTLGD